ncbi:glycosyltransferase family 22 protein, partial [Thermothielavioides terrestris NRRL 8126]
LPLSIPGLILAHLVVAPYTKVEESFNMQAAHDVLVYGTPTSDIHHKLSSTYDHFTFPGAVPRTFIGPVMLAGFAQPVVALVGFQHAQLIVRAILGLFNAACILMFAWNIKRAYGAGTARWYLLLQASQFHVVFYASRTLPNMFAFGLTTLAFAFLLPNPSSFARTAGRQRMSIAMFVFAAAVFRSEVALLLITTVFYLVLVPELSLERVIFPFATSFLTALATSIPIDSYFWQRPLWPELWGFYYNVVQGAASNWGVSPWHYYFSSALPRLLVNPLTYTALIPFSLWHPALRRAAAKLVIPSVLFIAIYSFQPHKETRFIFYAVPPLTAAAALSANFLFARQRKSKAPIASTLLTAALLLSVLASLLASTAMLALSALNYPGGEAVSHLRSVVLQDPTAAAAAADGNPSSAIIPVHADVLTCMTGLTLFSTTSSSFPPSTLLDATSTSSPPLIGQQQQHQNDGHRGGGGGVRLAVDRTEDPRTLARPDFWRRFAYLVLEDPAAIPAGAGEWEPVAVVQAYAGIEVLRPSSSSSSSSGAAVARPPVVGNGRLIAAWKRRVRAVTGGWWIGPRMVDRVYILRQRRGVADGR